MTLDLLTAAITAYQRGNQSTARELVQRELEQNPDNLGAWAWACELAASRDEKIHYLQQLLSRNPADQDAQQYLQRLQNAARPAVSTTQPAAKPPDLHQKPRRSGFAWVAAGLQMLIVLIVIVTIAAAIYTLPKSNFLGMRGPDFGSLIISSSFEEIESDDYVWEIVYEKSIESEFVGAVRHTSSIRESRFRILTHDILVTSGEYADPDIVNTSVSNHRFRWYSKIDRYPEGKLNLLHTIPANEEILTQLQAIEKWDQVAISGREILKVNVYDLAGNYLGNWHDTGCNTLVVNEVTVLE